MKYKIIYARKAEEDLVLLLKNEPASYKKALKLISELYDHPRTGTGHPEPLKGRQNQWSRRITKKHRIVYEIIDDRVLVLVLTAYGHYNDK